MAMSPQEMANAIIGNLKEKTGKSLEEWVPIAQSSGLDKHGKVVAWLKSEQGLTHGYANIIAHKALGSATWEKPAPASDVIDSHYQKGKEGLRPIYDKLAEVIGGFGDDIDFSPKKTYVSVRRKKQFATLGPGTKTRFDVGINLKGKPGTERLKKERPNSMCSHKAGVAGLDELDAELLGWLKEAYEAAG